MHVVPCTGAARNSLHEPSPNPPGAWENSSAVPAFRVFFHINLGVLCVLGGFHFHKFAKFF